VTDNTADNSVNASNLLVNPPQNIDMEVSLLGTLLLSSESVQSAYSILNPDAFYDPKHDRVWKAISALHTELRPTDSTSVSAKLADMGQLEGVGGKAAIVRICEMSPHGVDVEKYAKEIQGYYLLRQLTRVGNAIAKLGFNTTAPTSDVLQRAERELFAVTQQLNDGKDFVTIADVIPDIFSMIQERSTSELPPGIPTNFHDLDSMLNGLKPKKAYYLIGRPGSGKTAWAFQTAVEIAKQDKIALFFSLEMPAEELVLRLTSAESSIDSLDLEAGRVRADQWEPLGHAIARLTAIGNLKINDSPGLTIEDIASKCRKIQSETGNLGAVFIDHIHLMRDRRGRDELSKLTNITAEIKNLSKELNCAFLPLAQLNRGTESREDKRPQMSDIRSSGTAEQDADTIIGFYRADYYRKPEEGKDGICELGVLKNRGGKTGTVKLLFEAPYTRFKNLVSSHSSFTYKPTPPPPNRTANVEKETVDRALETTLGGETPW